MTFIKFREDTRGSHVHIDVFVGPDEEHLANAGRLVFREDEWSKLRDAVTAFGLMREVLRLALEAFVKVEQHHG